MNFKRSYNLILILFRFFITTYSNRLHHFFDLVKSAIMHSRLYVKFTQDIHRCLIDFDEYRELDTRQIYEIPHLPCIYDSLNFLAHLRLQNSKRPTSCLQVELIVFVVFTVLYKVVFVMFDEFHLDILTHCNTICKIVYAFKKLIAFLKRTCGVSNLDNSPLKNNTCLFQAFWV